jgi:S-DNA-T family DNA segregation ATPase FtsK/SpoIIIE
LRKRKNTGIFWMKISSIVLLIVAVFYLLGIFGFTGFGRNLSYLFTLLLGRSAWLIPFLCLLFSLILWPRPFFRKKYRRSKTDTSGREPAYVIGQLNKKVRARTKKETAERKESEEHSDLLKSFSLPKDKIVPIHGFENYFVSVKWPEINDIPIDNKMNELGKDFSTYFGEGQHSFKQPVRITTLKGLREYIEGVDNELGKEQQDQNSTIPETSEVTEEQHSQHSDSDNPAANFEQQISDFLAEEALDNSDKQDNHTTDEISQAENDLSKKLVEKDDLSEKSEERVSIGKEEISYIFELETESESGAAETEEEAETGHDADIEEDIETEDTETKVEKILTINEDLTINEVLALAEDTEIPLQIRRSWQLPSINFLDNLPQIEAPRETESSAKLEGVLHNFGIDTKVIRVTRGPVITRYELSPAPGVKISRIVNLADDIALGLAARDVRIEAPIPGKSAVGIEVPNKIPRAVSFREVIETPAYDQKNSKLKFALGKDIADQPVIADLAQMPHLLVAGATGSGKSVCITAIINSLLYNATPDEVKFLFIDPKMVELNQYNGIPHLLAPVVTDPKKAAAALKWIVKEMEIRYELFAAAGVRDIERYNKPERTGSNEEKALMLPWIVVIIDELADLMLVAAGQVEEAICRLAQMARAAGIHLVIATQRPSVDVITGIIKANIPSRISFAVTSSIDSRTILDTAGAEKLLGKGDMLYSPQGINKPQRVQGCLVNDEEVERVIAYWKSQGRPEYLDPEYLFAENRTEESGGNDDSLFINAGTLVINSGIASVSYLQRRLKLGYARAARLMDMLEENGVVGSYEGSKPRQILLSLDEFKERSGI